MLSLPFKAFGKDPFIRAKYFLAKYPKYEVIWRAIAHSKLFDKKVFEVSFVRIQTFSPLSDTEHASFSVYYPSSFLLSYDLQASDPWGSHSLSSFGPAALPGFHIQESRSIRLGHKGASRGSHCSDGPLSSTSQYPKQIGEAVFDKKNIQSF